METKPTQSTPTEVLEERLSDIYLTEAKRKATNDRLQAVYDLAKLSTTTIINAASAGNVQCKEALKKILPILDRIKKA